MPNILTGRQCRPLYYKTARGGPVDLIWKDALIKVSVLPKSQLSYDERPLMAALKVLKLKRAILVKGREGIETEGHLSAVPLSHWS